MTRPLRVVLDTNVVLSALVFREGVLTSVRLAWQSGRCRPLASEATARELVRVLAYPKFRLSEGERRVLLAEYLPYCTVVPVPRVLPGEPRSPDPDDLPFLRLAVAGRADCLVTGDKALRGVARFPIPVLASTELLERLEWRRARR